MSPVKAAEEAIQRIITKYPSFNGAIVAVNMHGDFGKSYHNILLWEKMLLL